ncbi:MAG: hypothetical protein HY902_15405 [Deltaproteobacteria bacterium]|nr:hypothetical protein [Deltaproteobacteria bacterium]
MLARRLVLAALVAALPATALAADLTPALLPPFQTSESEIDPLYQRDGCHWVSANEKELACVAITNCEGCMEFRVEVRTLGSKKRRKFVLWGGNNSTYQPKGFAAAQKYLNNKHFVVPERLPASAGSVRKEPGNARTLLVQVQGQTVGARLPVFEPRLVPTLSERAARDLPVDWDKVRARPAAERIEACCGDLVDALFWLPKARRVLAMVTSRCDFEPEPDNRLCLHPDYNAELDTESGFAVYVLPVPATPT